MSADKAQGRESVDHWKETRSGQRLENKIKFLADLNAAKAEIPEKEVKTIESGMETLLKSFIGGFRWQVIAEWLTDFLSIILHS